MNVHTDGNGSGGSSDQSTASDAGSASSEQEQNSSSNSNESVSADSVATPVNEGGSEAIDDQEVEAGSTPSDAGDEATQ